MDSKKIRGWIIRILHRAYPAGMEGSSIFKQLHDLGYEVTRRDLDANIAYVKENGYVELQKFGHIRYDDEMQNKIYKLTPNGVDLAERTIETAGIDL